MLKLVEKDNDYQAVIQKPFEWHLIGPIDERMYKMIVANQPSKSPDGLKIFINSGGGDINQAFAIYDLLIRLRSSGTRIKTVATGECYSGAAILLQAGEERFATPHASIMFHKGSFGVDHNDAEENYRTVKHYLELDELHKKIFTDRGVKMSKLGKARYFTAKAALDFGLIDGII